MAGYKNFWSIFLAIEIFGHILAVKKFADKMPEISGQKMSGKPKNVKNHEIVKFCLLSKIWPDTKISARFLASANFWAYFGWKKTFGQNTRNCRPENQW